MLKNRSTAKIIKTIVLSAVMVILAASVKTVFASEIVSQSNSSYELGDINAYGQYIQGIGTNLSGILGSITVYIYTHGNTKSGAVMAIVGTDSGCTDAGYNFCTNTNIVSTTSEPINIDGDGLYTFNFLPSNFILSTNKYYRFAFGAAWDNHMAIGGCASDCFTGGSGNSDFFGNGVLIEGHEVDAYFFVDTTATPTPPDYSTHISTVTPTNGSTVSTSTSFEFGVTGYVNPQDIDTDGLDIILSYREKYSQVNGCQGSFDAVCSLHPTDASTFTFHATTSGAFSFSTTTDIEHIGSYLQTTSIEKSEGFIYRSFHGNTTLISTSTSFIVSTTTTADRQAEDYINAYNDITDGTTTDKFNKDCNVLAIFNTFSPLACLADLFVPTPAMYQDVADTLKNDIFTHVPFGYITRTIDILNATTTTQLPELKATIPSGYPGGGGVVNLTPWGKLMGSSSVLSTATSTVDGKTFIEVIEPMWNLFVYFSFAFATFLALLGVVHPRNKNNTKNI